MWIGCFFGIGVATHFPIPRTRKLGVKLFPQLVGVYRGNLGIILPKTSDLCAAIGLEWLVTCTVGCILPT